ncbi:hypothetical protein [Nocardia carnea]|uniref:hypothetical protein n=1 Tax=Nocardia carnea TaxID=37328 RepID=UPI002457B74C|nr:hypothetical protein [Nocardia carnea]
MSTELPSAILVSGTVLAAGEDPDSDRVRAAIGPWRVIDWHNAYTWGGEEAVDALPGGENWRRALEDGQVAQRLGRIAERGFGEIIYTPSGPDVAAELRRFIAAGPEQPGSSSCDS